MLWYEIVDLVCTIISTLSIIVSALLLCFHFLRQISIHIVYENDFLNIYAYAYQKNIKLRSWKIYHKKKCLNPNDIFFANGENSISLDVQENILIKRINIKLINPKFLTVILFTENNKKIKRKCFIKRKKNEIYR